MNRPAPAAFQVETVQPAASLTAHLRILTAEQITELADLPVLSFRHAGLRFGTPGLPLPWAEERGLVVSAWGVIQMPREVALALRGNGSAPFDPRATALRLTPVATEVVEQEAAAAAAETLAAVTAVVQIMSSGPVPLLKTGGMGVRELRRIAKAAGQDEDRARFTIELIAAGGPAEASDAGLTPIASYDDFAAIEPADRLLDLVDDWLTMPACPLAPADPGDPASARVLYWDEHEEYTLVPLRGLFLRALAEAVPEGTATSPDGLAERIAWQGPAISDRADDDLDRYVTGIWREAHVLGLLAHGTPTALCRARLSGGPTAARDRAEAMLPRPLDAVLLQNDLTAVVTGTPSAALLELLDSAAAPESRSGAWTWRFSPASVRAALDAGHTAEELLARLAAVADGGRVPQTLSYLIDDLARRYGRVQVRPTGSCLCSEDTTLLTEIRNTRSLRPLGLVALAPTVLASAKPPAETLAALRAAGYTPASLQADGSPAIEIRQRRRAAPAPDTADFDDDFPALHDPAEVARTLLGRRGR
ncbi:Helicase conserved C-terminal domain-containing protein [Actinoplanes philippinensis]|uniref:Helicase conserved C-terminal domain-containing protein n=1 Tax=Actinoplanes philippinensis TaxID=35752 RepID=A0A1I2C2X9_9ACTN|nr:Helicase conserved C-terminal domain-containing protein [Actinoplanes philippinensis]